MASQAKAPEYLPPLNDCLSGDATLFSWAEAFFALCDLDILTPRKRRTPSSAQPRQHSALELFLTHETSRTILSRNLEPFQGRSADTKKAFDTATAPINATPSDASKELIDDSLWLSEETKIDETSSLRIVILEKQGRARLQLSSGLTEEEAVGIQEAWKNSSLRGPNFTLGFSILGAPAKIEKGGSSSQEQRRKRLLELFLTERNAILGVVKLLLQHALSDHMSNDSLVWVKDLSTKVVESHMKLPLSSDALVTDIVPTAVTALREAFNTAPWNLVSEDRDFTVLWSSQQITQMILILQCLFVHIAASKIPLKGQDVVLWYECMADFEFFTNFEPAVSQSSISLFQLLISSISLAILKIQSTVDMAREISTFLAKSAVHRDIAKDLYFSDLNCLLRIHEIVEKAMTLGPSPATPAVLAWSLISQAFRYQKSRIDEAREAKTLTLSESSEGRRHSTASNEADPTVFHQYVLRVAQEPSEGEPDALENIARSSIVDGNIFQLIGSFMSLLGSACGSRNELVIESHIRVIFLGLISEVVRVVQYSEEIVIATLAITSPPPSQHNGNAIGATNSAVRLLLNDPNLREVVLLKSFLRFPLEIIPALKLSRAAMTAHKDGELPEILSELCNMKALTMATQSQHYRLLFESLEDEFANPRAKLKGDLRLFAPLSGSNISWRSRRAAPSNNATFVIPAGAEGYTAESGENIVVSLEFEYSAIDYLAKLMSTASVNADCIEAMSGKIPDLSVTCESIAFITSVLGAHAGTNDTEGAVKILDQARNSIGSDGDLISLVLDIFEKSLQSEKLRSDSDLTVELYSNCIKFLEVLIRVQPSRVWSFLGRTQFLELHRHNVNLASIILAVETVLGQYDLLKSCISLTNALVENAITGAVKPKVSAKALTRFGSLRSPSAPSPAKSQSAVIAAFLKVFTGVLESLPNWRFNNPIDQLEINTSLILLFDKILTYTYGFDDPTKEKGHLAEVMFPSAKYLLDIYLSSSSNEMPVLPTLNLLAVGLKLSPSTIHIRSFELIVAQTKAALSFSTTLLRVGILMNHPTSRFEQLLFKSAPIITRLFARLISCQSNILKLLTAMIESGGRTSEEPPSLLGHLGIETAKSFLQLLSSSSRRPQQAHTGVDLWNFLSKIITTRQQWLTVYLLTGKSPRESLRSTASSPSSDGTKYILVTALEKATNLGAIPEQEALAILRFVSAVQSYVPWALVKHEVEYKACKESMISTISNMQWDSKSAKQKEKTHELSMAALITEILAMEIHDARNRGVKVDPRHLYPHLHLLRNSGVEPPAYNSSLHASLQKNIEAKFEGCKLEHFKHTSTTSTYLGPNYCYDLDLATKLLGGDKSWKEGSDDGYWHEFCRANINLSFVESQIMLLNSWKLLSLEMSNGISGDDQWTQALVQTAGDCLKANAETQLPEAFSERLSLVRVDFAFALIQKLVKVKCRDPNALGLIHAAWAAILSSVPDFSNVFATPTADYARSLLRVLFLTLQFHVWGSTSNGSTNGSSTKQKASELHLAIDVTPTMLEILNKVVATGFRCLANILHDDPSLSLPSDFVLITAILQKLLLVPSVRTIQHEIASDVAKNETSRYATTLFSWADRLASNDGDPLYGELSILFLLELSIITPVAEHLAVEGVLSQLNNAAIMEYLRRPSGTGPFSHPPRMFSIWHRGILPVCLNLLYAVGPPIAAEVATFLNQFPGQLERAATSLSSRTASPSMANPNVGRITLGMASEAHSLALISLLLDQYRLRGPSEGIVAADVPLLDWDRMGVKDDIEGWVQGRAGLRNRIAPADEKELELLGARASDAASESKLEERIISEFAGALECLKMSIPS